MTDHQSAVTAVVEWRAFCKSEDIKEIASSRFGRLVILAHEEGLLALILAGESEEVRKRASGLSETLLGQNLSYRLIPESTDSTSSTLEFEPCLSG
jgi:hypothetical protein